MLVSDSVLSIVTAPVISDHPTTDSAANEATAEVNAPTLVAPCTTRELTFVGPAVRPTATVAPPPTDSDANTAAPALTPDPKTPAFPAIFPAPSTLNTVVVPPLCASISLKPVPPALLARIFNTEPE